MVKRPMSEEKKQALVARLAAGKKAKVAETKPEVLPADLQAIIDAIGFTPQDRAKMARHAFGSRGWPNEEHPGTVRDFLIENNIQII